MKLPTPYYFETTMYDGTRNHTSYYTEAQLKQAIDDALEEAAQLCDAEAVEWRSAAHHIAKGAARHCAAYIRNLKEPK